MKLHRKGTIARKTASVKVDVKKSRAPVRLRTELAALIIRPRPSGKTCTEMTVEVNDLFALKHGESECQLLTARFKAHGHISWLCR